MDQIPKIYGQNAMINKPELSDPAKYENGVDVVGVSLDEIESTESSDRLQSIDRISMMLSRNRVPIMVMIVMAMRE